MDIPSSIAIPADECNYAAEIWRRGLRSLRSDGLREIPIAVLERLSEFERKAQEHAARVTPNVTAVTPDSTPSATIEIKEVDTATAARILKVEIRAVAARCRRQTLPSRKVDGRWMVRREYLTDQKE